MTGPTLAVTSGHALTRPCLHLLLLLRSAQACQLVINRHHPRTPCAGSRVHAQQVAQLGKTPACNAHTGYDLLTSPC